MIQSAFNELKLLLFFPTSLRRQSEKIEKGFEKIYLTDLKVEEREKSLDFLNERRRKMGFDKALLTLTWFFVHYNFLPKG